jgi:hypothetical protein
MSKFSLYFSGCCIPINAYLIITITSTDTELSRQDIWTIHYMDFLKQSLVRNKPWMCHWHGHEVFPNLAISL